MAYTVDVLYTKNEDFSNPSTVTESGQPNSVDLENLDSFEVYYTKAVLKNDGVTEDESNIESFQTLPAGTITLTHQSSVRSGSNYIVTYTYTSTYALSSSVLTCGVSISSQGVIAGNTITFTVSGLVPGDAYMSQITTIDMYGESAQTSITLIMPVVNEVSITGTTTTSSTVVCELDYTIDGGFTQAWVDYWDENADPSTDIPQGHSTFTDGADTCTITGLTDGTTYQLRATIYYGGYVNYVVSSVVRATTVTDYSTKYFTIKNTGTGTSTVKLIDKGVGQYQPVYVSTDYGSTWTAYNPSTSGRTLGTLRSGEKMLLKHTGAMAPNMKICLGITNSVDGPIEMSGNIASLCFGDNFTGTQTMPGYAYAELFSKSNTVSSIDSSVTNIDVSNLSFVSYNTVSRYGLEGMFRNCPISTTTPYLSSITSVDDYGMFNMFNGCTSLTASIDLSNITSVGINGMCQMFYGCTSLTNAPNLSGITTIGNYGLTSMFKFCTSLNTTPDFRSVTRINDYGMQSMFSDCTALTTGPDFSRLSATIGNSIMAYMFYKCMSLTTAYAPTVCNSTTFTNWMESVSDSGTLYVPSRIYSAVPNNSVSGCPSGWTKERI